MHLSESFRCGHPRDPENTYWRGARSHCATCHRKKRVASSAPSGLRRPASRVRSAGTDLSSSVAGLLREEAIRRGLHAIVRIRSGVFGHGPAASPPAGEHVTYASADAANEVCAQMARDAKYGGDGRAIANHHASRPRLGRRGSPTHFPCGHLRTPENIYGAASRSRCRACVLKHSAEWRKAHADHVRSHSRRYRGIHAERIRDYRRQHQLAYLLYFQLRKILQSEGLWLGHADSARAQRGAA